MLWASAFFTCIRVTKFKRKSTYQSRDLLLLFFPLLQQYRTIPTPTGHFDIKTVSCALFYTNFGSIFYCFPNYFWRTSILSSHPSAEKDFCPFQLLVLTIHFRQVDFYNRLFCSFLPCTFVLQRNFL